MKHLNGNVCFALNATQKYSKNEMLMYLIKYFQLKLECLRIQTPTMSLLKFVVALNIDQTICYSNKKVETHIVRKNKVSFRK